MSLIIIIGCIWGICKAISAASAASRERARQAEIERVRRMVELEKEQARQAKEQERMAKALAKEEAERKAADENLARAVLALNKKLENAYHRISKAEDEIERFASVMDSEMAKKEAAEAELSDVRGKLVLIDDWSCTDPRTDKGMAFYEKYNDADKFAKGRDEYEKLIGFDKRGNLLDPAKAQDKLTKREAALVKSIEGIDGRIFAADQKIKNALHNKYDAEMDKAFCESKLSA